MSKKDLQKAEDAGISPNPPVEIGPKKVSKKLEELDERLQTAIKNIDHAREILLGLTRERFAIQYAINTLQELYN